MNVTPSIITYHFTVELNAFQAYELKSRCGQAEGYRLLEHDGKIVGCVADAAMIASFLHCYPDLAGHTVPEEPGR